MVLRLLSFNIWFSSHEMEMRMQALGDIIAQNAPDLIALQEMTEDHWALLSKHKALEGYSWTPAARQPYYTLIGSRFPPESQRFPFKGSRMGRDLLAVTVKPPELPPLVFATSHLESLNEHEARRQQIAVSLQDHLKDAEDAIFCGDTNINEAIDGDVRLPADWKDPWPLLRSEGGFTFDVERNRMMAKMDGWARKHHARLRFDRFWIKVRNYVPVAIDLLDEAIQEELWPSDHFGLLLTLEEAHRHL